jgi:hypothetical protein
MAHGTQKKTGKNSTTQREAKCNKKYNVQMEVGIYFLYKFESPHVGCPNPTPQRRLFQFYEVSIYQNFILHERYSNEQVF